MGEQLGVVADALACDLRDPASDRPMLSDPRPSRELTVRHLTCEGVPEGVLDFTLYRGTTCWVNERSSRQLLKAGLDGGRVSTADRGECS
jgi:hypothetical protein